MANLFGLTALWLFLAAQAKAEMPRCHAELVDSLPITFAGFVPAVHAMINGRDVAMGIDVGDQATMVTPEGAEYLGLAKDSTHSTKVIGGAGNAKAGRVFLEKFEIGTSVSRQHMSVTAVSIVLPKPELPDGKKIVGLVGMDVLKDLEIEYDAVGGKFSLYKLVGSCSDFKPDWKGPFIGIKATVTPTGRFTFPVEIDGHRVMALFDSGAARMRIAHDAAVPELVSQSILEKDSLADVNGAGVASVKVFRHEFKYIRIGNEAFPKPKIDVASFPTTEAGLLMGEDYMRSRRFWLSPARNKIFVQKPAAAK
ncbi:MAG: retroviral-like aspartic protease family protein [Bdellovibrionota bacterium]